MASLSCDWDLWLFCCVLTSCHQVTHKHPLTCFPVSFPPRSLKRHIQSTGNPRLWRGNGTRAPNERGMTWERNNPRLTSRFTGRCKHGRYLHGRAPDESPLQCIRSSFQQFLVTEPPEISWADHSRGHQQRSSIVWYTAFCFHQPHYIRACSYTSGYRGIQGLLSAESDVQQNRSSRLGLAVG